MSDKLNSKEIDVLCGAISDIGYWNWWNAKFPEHFQIEFGGVQMYFPSDDIEEAPNPLLAIVFLNPKSVNLISKDETSENAAKWFEDLYNSETEPPNCDYYYFTFSNKDIINEIVSQAETIDTLFGYSPIDEQFLKENVQFAFWAGNFGAVVSADDFKIYSAKGEIELSEIDDLHSQWWDYWERYWESKRNSNPFPYDYACEVTIPAGK